MKFRSLVAAAAALTMTTAPVLAQSASSELERSAAPALNESSVEGESTILLILAVIAAGVGIYLLADNGSDKPASP